MKNNKKFQDLTPEEMKRQMVVNSDSSKDSNNCVLEIRCQDGKSGACMGDTASGCSVTAEKIGNAWYAQSISCINGNLKTTIECDNSGIPGDREEVNSGVASNPVAACDNKGFGDCQWMEYGFLHSGRCVLDPNSHSSKFICVETNRNL